MSIHQWMMIVGKLMKMLKWKTISRDSKVDEISELQMLETIGRNSNNEETRS